MNRATVNYHMASPERQAYHIDADGVVGRLLSPPHDVVEVRLTDVRDEPRAVDFARDGVTFLHSPTAVGDFTSADWEAAYEAELAMLLKRTLGVRAVILFDHTLRIDDAQSTRQPARNVHSDYSRDGAHQRLRDLVGDAADAWEAGRFAFVNVWRPVGAPIRSTPLGFVRPSSVAPEDWLTLDLVYPDRLGQIMGLVASPAHEWIYCSEMTPDEVAVFNIYDNSGFPSVPHSALDLLDQPPVGVPRQSIESRALVRY